MSLDRDEESDMDHQHYLNDVNSAAKSVEGQPHHSTFISERDVGRDEKYDAVINQRDEAIPKLPVGGSKLAELSTDASTAADSERRMSLSEGIKLYPKAIFFSFALSLAVVMEGYDTWLLSNFYGMAAFAKKYGQYTGLDRDGNPSYQLSATWQNALGNGTSAAQIIGLFINGVVAERIGYRWTMIGALFAITCFTFIQFFAVNVEMLLAGYIMSGLPWQV
jgi:SP family general alpha glucoside:H+ symporter-like MFS transporter